MEDKKINDCSRACTVERTDDNELLINYSLGCSKLAVYNWPYETPHKYFEINIKTHKIE